MIFVARSKFESNVAEVVFETAVFGSDGNVANMTLLDLGRLLARGMRVRQFDLSNMQCDVAGSLLINGVQAYEKDVDCEGALVVSSCSNVEPL